MNPTRLPENAVLIETLDGILAAGPDHGKAVQIQRWGASAGNPRHPHEYIRVFIEGRKPQTRTYVGGRLLEAALFMRAVRKGIGPYRIPTDAPTAETTAETEE